MKKFIFLLFMGTLLFSGCSNELEETKSNTSKDLEFAKLCSSIEELGTMYDSPSTRAFNWTKWGGRIFAATVDGLTAYVAGPAGVIVGPMCSWAFEDNWEACTRGTTRAGYLNNNPKKKTGPTPTYVFKDDILTQNDSIGYYHNMILDFLANSGKEYIKDNGEIDYLAILTDCMSAAAKYGIKTTLSETEKRKYADFSKDVVTAFAECTQDTDAINKALEKANHSYFEKFKTNANLEKTEYFQKIVAETLNGMNNDNNIITYADQVNTLLKNSNISVSLKKELKTITSVTINSQLYWNNI